MSHSLTLGRSLAVRSMACKKYTMNEVVSGLDGGDFEDGEDDFDGYLDSDKEAYTNERRLGAVEGDEVRTEEDVLIGTDIERE